MGQSSASPRPTWLRRLGCLGAFLAWLLVMTLPLAALILAMAGQIDWQRGEFTRDRVWLVQEIEERGLGYASERVISDERADGGPVCVRTRVRFFMWRGAGQPAEFCECYSAQHEPLGACPQPSGASLDSLETLAARVAAP